jgi:WD40 repeat protein
VSGPAARLVAGTSATFADYPVDAAWTADGRLVVAGGEGELAIVDPGSGAVTALGRHDPGVLNVVVAAASQSVLTSGQDGSVRQWPLPGPGAAASTGGGKVIHRGTAWPQSLALSADGQYVAFAAGRAVRVHRADGELLRSFDDLGHSASLLAWRGRMNELAAAGQTHAWLCEIGQGVVTQLELEGGPVTLAYSPDGRVLVAGLQDGVVSFRYVATQKKSRMSGYEGKVTHTAWSANSRYLASAASGASTVILWDFGGKGPEGSAPMQLGTHVDRIEALAFQPGGKLLATAGRDWRVALWHPGPQYKPAKDGTLPQSLDVHLLTAVPSLLRWSLDGQRLAVAQGDGRVLFYSVQQGAV